VDFEWDYQKNAANLRKHGIPFEEAVGVFEDPRQLTVLDRVVKNETRLHTTGKIGNAIILLVVHTHRQRNGTMRTRIISARRASRKERAAYEKAKI
jgi:uncharacterized protein